MAQRLMAVPDVANERAWQTIIQEGLTREGWKWQHVFRLPVTRGGRETWRTSTTAVGFPDLTAWRAPWSLACELKMHRAGTKAGEPSEAQVGWLETFARTPWGLAWVLRPEDDWQAIANWLHDPRRAPRIHGWTPGPLSIPLPGVGPR